MENLKFNDNLLSVGMFALTFLLFANMTNVVGSNEIPKKKTARTKGSFLLKPVDTTSLAYKVLAQHKIELLHKESTTNLLLKTASRRTEDISKELIRHHNDSMGPNLSLFYKDEGGLLVEKGNGCYMVIPMILLP
jgi:hypothetical protein